MDQAVFKELLLKKRAEILSEGGGKPLQTWMGKDARQADFADKASVYSEAHIQSFLNNHLVLSGIHVERRPGTVNAASWPQRGA